MRRFRSAARPAPSEDDHRRLREVLAKFDPWSFWSVALDGPAADYLVIGVTGAFAIGAVGLEGYAEPSGSGLQIGGVELTGFREITRAARRLHGRLLEASAFTDVQPVLCLTRATAGQSRTVKGVRVVRLEDLLTEIVARERSLDPSTAKHAAEAIGRVLPGPSGPVAPS